VQSRSIEAKEGCEHTTVMLTTNLQQQFFASIGTCTNISKWIDASVVDPSTESNCIYSAVYNTQELSTVLEFVSSARSFFRS